MSTRVVQATLSSIASCFLALALTGCGHAEHPVSATPPSWLDGRADEVARTASSSKAGQRAGDTLRGHALEDDGRQEWTVNLDDQHCYVFGGVGETSVQKFALYIWDPHGKRQNSERSGTSTAVMEYCPKIPGPHRVQGKVGEGYGHFAVAIYATGGLEKPPPPASIEKLIEQQASSAAPGAVRTHGYFENSPNADRTDWFAALEAGHCYWFIGAGETGQVKKLSMYLWDSRDKRVTQTFADSNTAMVGHCPTASGMYRFQAKVESGSGRYKVGVFDKASGTSP
ncbi:hypothetical protein LVJ94_30715 [Pendulispora rubella]|uniref:Uncharacterized protein n=1 Tax=Pendulispora rubella TaxID=2741070 RepID=A0ABZ2KRJ4_9BACT